MGNLIIKIVGILLVLLVASNIYIFGFRKIDSFSNVKSSDRYLLCLNSNVVSGADIEHAMHYDAVQIACFNIADEIVLSTGTVNSMMESGLTTFYLSDTNMTSEEYCNFANGTWDTVCYCPSDKYFNKEAAQCVPNNN